MLSLLLAFLLSPSAALPQKPAFTAADAHAIEALVVEEIVPADGVLDSRRTKGRTLLIDPDQVSAVMGKLIPGTPNPGLAISRAFLAASHDAAIQCAGPGHNNCQFVNDGLYLYFLEAAFVPATGEVRVRAGVTWTDFFPHSRQFNGYDIDLFFARTDSGWRLMRKGGARVG